MIKVINSKKIRVLWYLVFVFGFLFLVFDFSYAATLYLEPQTQDVHIGDTFIIEIRLETQEVINAVEVNLSFSTDILQALDFSTAGSALTVWAQAPAFDQAQGLFSFVGGVPGGLSGDLYLGKIIFSVVPRDIPRDSTRVVFKDDSMVLLNDGQGTLADLEIQRADIEILAQAPEIVQDQWQKQIDQDTTPPEPFQLYISQDISERKSQYFIIFSTIDKQTGIDYYEVREGDTNWQRAKGPYVLTDQELKGIIQVKAVDKAGNERIEIIEPEKKLFPYGIVILVLIAIGVIAWLIKRKT